MFARLVHLLMCLTVLGCPAMGGACCGVADGSGVAVDECQDRCCCNTKQNEAPMAPDCPEPCHDCFCAGALPPGFGATVEFDVAADILAVVPIVDLASSTQRLEFASRDESPPHGRMLLMSYCRFLL